MADFSKWIAADWSSAVNVFASTLLIFCILTICIRIAGLRSLSKMSSTDFIFTVAIGSLVATVISAPQPSVIIGLAAILSVFIIQYVSAALRRSTNIASDILDNQPCYLMYDGNVIHANLDAASVSLSELHAKLREANVWSYTQVIHVVMETTGDISVLHRTKDDVEPTPAIFDDVAPPAANSIS